MPRESVIGSRWKLVSAFLSAEHPGTSHLRTLCDSRRDLSATARSRSTFSRSDARWAGHLLMKPVSLRTFTSPMRNTFVPGELSSGNSPESYWRPPNGLYGGVISVFSAFWAFPKLSTRRQTQLFRQSSDQYRRGLLLENEAPNRRRMQHRSARSLVLSAARMYRPFHGLAGPFRCTLL